jgi:hypothetical protein
MTTPTGWPVRPKQPHYPGYYIPSTSAPVLLVHALWDDATPYGWALEVNRKINGSVLLTRAGEGHGSWDYLPINNIMSAYFVDPIKNLPKPLTVVDYAVQHDETDGFTDRGLAVNTAVPTI